MRRLIATAATLCFGLAAGLVCAEGALRLFRLAPPTGLATVNQGDFEAVPGLLKPNQQLVDERIPVLAHHVEVDSLGYRGEHFARAKPTDEFRMVAIGDSFTYGDYVDDAETLPALLQRELRARCGNVRVINAGVGGTTIVTHARMADRALALSPDVVLLTFSENDVTDLALPLWYALEDNRRRKSRFPLSVAYPVLRHTALWNLALDVKARIAARKLERRLPPGPVLVTKVAARDSVRRRLRTRYEAALGDLRDDLGGAGVPLAFAAYPSHLTLEDPERSDQIEWAMNVARGTLDVPAIDLLAPLRESGLPVETLYLLPHDGHPSPTGYGIAAAAIADRLRAVEPLASFCAAGTEPSAISRQLSASR